MNDLPVTISLTRYREPDWLVRDALRSLARQEGIRARVLLLDQAKSARTESLCRELCTPAISFTYLTIPERSLAFARNRAIEMCDTEVLLFIDPDAVADAHWAARLSETLGRHRAAAASGKVVPMWHGRPPWISRSNWVREQYSLLDLGPYEIEAAKVIGTNFGLNLERAGDRAYFDETLGRAAGNLLGGEETDLSDRLLLDGHRISYNGAAIVGHQVMPDRLRYSWLVRRFHYAGIGRARRGGRPAPTHGMVPWDVLAVSIFAVPYLSGFLRGKIT